MKTKKCSQCGIEKSISEFSKNKKEKDGLRYWCKNCCERWRQENNRKKRQWFNNYKKTLKCKICGYKGLKCLNVLVFHHRNPEEKKYTVSTMIVRGCSKETILKEIKKCDVYCENHHRELHYKN